MVNKTMNDLNENLKFEVTVLTPIHVGGATENHWKLGIDYITDEGKTWILNLDRVVEILGTSAVSRCFFEGRSLKDFRRALKLNDVSYKVFNKVVNTLEIKRHIFSGLNGDPYIPGSTIKGAISSILLNYFCRKTNRRKFEKVEEIMGNFESSVMRYFGFSDVYFSDTVLFTTKLFNLKKNDNYQWVGAWKHGKDNSSERFMESRFTTTYECLKTNNKAILTLTYKKGDYRIAEKLIGIIDQASLPPNHTRDFFRNFSPSDFCKIVNEHTLNHIKKELNFLEIYNQADYTDALIDSWEEIKNKLEEINTKSKPECILRLASGVGFHSITGDWIYSDYTNTGIHSNGKKKYKSRKVAFDINSNKEMFSPMGFLHLRLLSEKEVSELEQIQRRTEVPNKSSGETNESPHVQIEPDLISPPLKKEAKKPQMFTGRLKEGVTLDAEVVQSGTPNLVKVYVPGYENKNLQMQLYRGSLPVGTIVEVEVNNFNRKQNRIVSVKYVKMKT